METKNLGNLFNQKTFAGECQRNRQSGKRVQQWKHVANFSNLLFEKSSSVFERKKSNFKTWNFWNSNSNILKNGKHFEFWDTVYVCDCSSALPQCFWLYMLLYSAAWVDRRSKNVSNWPPLVKQSLIFAMQAFFGPTAAKLKFGTNKRKSKPWINCILI